MSALRLCWMDTVDHWGDIWSRLTDKPTERDFDLSKPVDTAQPEHGMTTRKELWSWYIYDWANSAYSGVALSFVVPLFLAALAQQYACENNTPHGCDFEGDAIDSSETVQVDMTGWKLKPASYAASIISLSALFQAFSSVFPFTYAPTPDAPSLPIHTHPTPQTQSFSSLPRPLTSLVLSVCPQPSLPL